MREFELKAVVDDAELLVARLRRAGAVTTFVGELIDRRYDTPAGTMVEQDNVVRLRTYRTSDGHERSVLDWKGPTEYIDGYKVREERTTRVDDASVIDTVLAAAGLVVIREIDRQIEMFELDGAVLRLERYPRLDTLIEVEGTPEQIERAITCSGIPRDAFTSERLTAFVARFETRSGLRAALSQRELASVMAQEPM